MQYASYHIRSHSKLHLYKKRKKTSGCLFFEILKMVLIIFKSGNGSYIGQNAETHFADTHIADPFWPTPLLTETPFGRNPFWPKPLLAETSFGRNSFGRNHFCRNLFGRNHFRRKTFRRTPFRRNPSLW